MKNYIYSDLINEKEQKQYALFFNDFFMEFGTNKWVAGCIVWFHGLVRFQNTLYYYVSF